MIDTHNDNLLIKEMRYIVIEISIFDCMHFDFIFCHTLINNLHIMLVLIPAYHIAKSLRTIIHSLLYIFHYFSAAVHHN